MAKKKKHRRQPELKKKVTFRGRLQSAVEYVLKPRPWRWNVLYIFLACVIITLLAEWISRADATITEWTGALLGQSFLSTLKWVITYPVAFLSATALFFLVALLLYAVFNSTGVAVLVPGIVYCGLSAANYFKLFARNEPLLPWDFILIGAAAEFAGSVGLKFTPHIFIAFGGVLLLSLAAFLLNRGWGKEKRRALPVLRAKRLHRLISAASILAVIIIFVISFFINAGWRKAWGFQVNSWNQTRDYENYGVLNMLTINCRYILVDKPAGYNENAIDKLRSEVLEKAEADGTLDKLDGKQEVTPNIIYVMLEAFGDADLLKNFSYSENITATSDWLEENAVSGSLLTSIFGGGTSITEYMALTGMSTSFLPPGSTPYQQYVNDPVDAWPSYLKETHGYETVAIHPYGAAYWNRNVAYPNMGSDTFWSKDNSFKGAPRCRKCNYVTDDAVMEHIIETYKAHRAESADPLFVHAITIANHQAYHLEDYTDEERVKITSTEPLSEELQIAFESYVTGLRDTDRAMQLLLDYFQTVDEPTIILFFGDHWGKTGTVNEAFVPAGLFDEGELYSSHENVRRAYSVPFYIWDNYLGLKGQVENLSAYQLTPMLTELYGLDRPVYFEYLRQQMDIFRGHYSNTVLDAAGVASGKKPTAVKNALAKMELLQYDLLFGKNYLYR